MLWNESILSVEYVSVQKSRRVGFDQHADFTFETGSLLQMQVRHAQSRFFSQMGTGS